MTARSSRPSGTGAASASSTPAVARARCETGSPTGDPAELARQVSLQAERAIAAADVVLLVVDVTVGVTEEDDRVARILRKAELPVLVVANKVDDERREADVWGLQRLGLGDPYPVSALHGRGSGDLLDAIVADLPPEADAGDASR